MTSSSETYKHLQPADFQILAVHDDVVESEEHWEPEFDHRLVDGMSTSFLCCTDGALRRGEHRRDDVPQHRHGRKTDLLELACLAKVAHTDREVSERPVPDDGGEVLLVQPGDDLETRGRYSLCKAGSAFAKIERKSTYQSEPWTTQRTRQTSSASRSACCAPSPESSGVDTAAPCRARLDSSCGTLCTRTA